MGIGKRIGLGFGLIILILTVLGVWSVIGTMNIVENAGEVIDGNKIRSQITSAELAHMNWASQVNSLLTDPEVTKLRVETDPAKCSFGKWFHSEARKEAEKLVPELKALFAKIEPYHEQVHKSAIEIDSVFLQGDETLPAVLTEMKSKHLQWASKLRDSILNKEHGVGVQTDPTRCDLGKWMSSEEAKHNYETGDADYRKSYDQLTRIHAELHSSAKDIDRVLKASQLTEGQSSEDELFQDLQVKSELFAKTLDDAMVKGIDPAKEDAGKKNDLELFLKWAKVDEEMNESLTQVFMEARILAERLMRKPTEENWNIFEEKTKELDQNLQEWFALVKGNEVLEQAASSLETVNQKFKGITLQLKNFLQNEKEQLQKANSLYKNKVEPLLGKTLESLENLKKEAEHALEGMRKARKVYNEKTLPALEGVKTTLREISETTTKNVMTDEQMLKAARDTSIAVVLLSVAGFIAGIILGFFITRSIAGPVRMIIEALGAASSQVSNASGQIASSSQSLAENASEQASSLEQVSASIEQMTSMIRKNSEGAQQASKLAEKSRSLTSGGIDDMKKMEKAIAQIKESSNKTVSIIETINEIAFQTNLLAINAAVEAARAGEAGKGFAVVADEVRNLAQRSAEAARNTADLIEGSKSITDEGVEIGAKMSSSLTQIGEAISSLTQLINDVATANSEQAEGISQINAAVNQMDKVTQQNASSAEQMASSSEELNGQSLEMNDAVLDLQVLVEGVGGNARGVQVNPNRQLSAGR